MRQRWATERIPIACPPLPGEALDSWIEAYARRLRITAFHFLRFVELPQARVGKMTIRLHAQEARRLSAVAGVQESVLRSLTLEPFDQMAVRLHPDRRAMKAPPSWRSGGASTRFCPRCLHDNGGRWLLAWRLPWTFCCLRHNCQLIGQCPACHKPPRISGSRFGGPSRPGQCANGVHAQAPGGRMRPCPLRLPPAPGRGSGAAREGPDRAGSAGGQPDPHAGPAARPHRRRAPPARDLRAGTSIAARPAGPPAHSASSGARGPERVAGVATRTRAGAQHPLQHRDLQHRGRYSARPHRTLSRGRPGS